MSTRPERQEENLLNGLNKTAHAAVTACNPVHGPTVCVYRLCMHYINGRFSFKAPMLYNART